LLFVLFLSACATEPTPSTAPKRVLAPVSFGDLPGWRSDAVAEALPAFRRSCDKLAHKPDWAKPCAALAALHEGDHQAARSFFETWFRPYAASDNGNSDGLFTGYYEAELRGSTERMGRYKTPIYARPSDLIAVDLGDFKSEWKGKHLVGKTVGQKLKPYDDRATIVRGSLNNRASILAYVDDPVSAFFLAVQGSGRIRLEDGRILRIGYDGANGREYVAIGRKLADSGDLPKPVTMQSIRAWLAAHPDRADEAMNWNPSYVFFRVLQGDGPIGAQNVALTARRSLAVDPAFVALGTPVWLDSADGDGNVLQRLMIAQDTGGAIKGVVRGDVFWGFGAEAEAKAGPMQSRGRYFLLLPKTVKSDDQ
jgi:membrane-bound lytic murein transglycosylase A